MFRFERKGMVKGAADVPAAVKFATEVTSYLNKRHSLNMKFGVELFGKATICLVRGAGDQVGFRLVQLAQHALRLGHRLSTRPRRCANGEEEQGERRHQAPSRAAPSARHVAR